MSHAHVYTKMAMFFIFLIIIHSNSVIFIFPLFILPLGLLLWKVKISLSNATPDRQAQTVLCHTFPNRNM